jgi:hypothetical protein
VALSTAGFGRKLLLFFLLDAVFGTATAIWRGSFLAGAARFLMGFPMSLILAALWNATERKTTRSGNG